MMTEEPENIVLHHLRRIEKLHLDTRGDIHEIRTELQEIRIRLSHVEEGVTMLNRRFDRLDGRMMRAEQRLDLRETDENT